MNPTDLLAVLHTAERLKDTTRHCYTSQGRHESVAEHSWRLTIMAFFLQDEFPEADMMRVMKMCLFHDMGEVFTGDIPAFRKTQADEEEEGRQVEVWIQSLPHPYKNELTELFEEMEEKKTLEAQIYKALDRMEALIQHNEAALSTWLPLEYDLQMTYGEKDVQFSGYLKELKRQINEDSEKKAGRTLI